MSSEPNQPKRVSWSFRSFQFHKDQTEADMALDCKITFCLKADRLNGKCQAIPDECSAGYAKRDGIYSQNGMVFLPPAKPIR